MTNMFDRLRSGLMRVQSDIDSLFRLVSGQPSFRFATVVSVSPLLIRYDLEDNAVAGTPDRLVANLRVGDRVWCYRQFHRDVIVGVAKGADTGWRNLSLASGYTVYNGYTPQYRLIGGILYLRGALTPTSGNMPVVGQTVITNAIPELSGKTSVADSHNVAACFGPTGGTIMRVYVNDAAQLAFGGSSQYGSGAASYMSLAGASGKFIFSD